MSLGFMAILKSSNASVLYKKGGEKKKKRKRNEVVPVKSASDAGNNLSLDKTASDFDRKVITKSGSEVYIPVGETIKQNKERIRRVNRLGRKAKRSGQDPTELKGFKF